MASVSEPKIGEVGIICRHCPFTDEHGTLHDSLDRLCRDWQKSHDGYCPRNMEEYAEAVKLAEQEAAK